MPEQHTQFDVRVQYFVKENAILCTFMPLPLAAQSFEANDQNKGDAVAVFPRLLGELQVIVDSMELQCLQHQVTPQGQVVAAFTWKINVCTCSNEALLSRLVRWFEAQRPLPNPFIFRVATL
jgi:hypothetical protein